MEDIVIALVIAAAKDAIEHGRLGKYELKLVHSIMVESLTSKLERLISGVDERAKAARYGFIPAMA